MRKKILKGIAIVMGVFCLALLVGWHYLTRLPPPDRPHNTTVIFYDITGEPFLEEMVPTRRRFAALDDISPYVIEGFIATEDRNFFHHNGFYYPSIIRSIFANLRAGANVQGGSTITQQYARNLMVDFEQTVDRKLREAVYTIRLESHYTKEEILEGYLNTINFGHGVYGIEEAAYFYFGIPASDLTLAQASMLIGIPKGPSVYSPITNYDNARDRQKIVLSAMVETEIITEAEKNKAIETVFEFLGKRPAGLGVNHYFIDATLREVMDLLEDYGGLTAFEALRVSTTLDRDIQQTVEDAVDAHMRAADDLQNVVIVMAPDTGYVLALSGGREYDVSQFNRALFSERQVGSIIKPFLYLAALEYGFTPSTAFISRPTTFFYQNGTKTYTPGNYMNRYAFEEISMANALAISDNIFAVKTHDFLGMHLLPNMMQRLGVTAEIEEIPSTALGVSNINMMEMVEAYSVLASGGREVNHQFVIQIKDDDGVIVDNRNIRTDHDYVVDPTDVFILNEMMRGMFNLAHNNHLSATGLSILPQVSHIYGGKTGSTDTDSWMAGYTPDLMTLVWVGYDEGQIIGDHQQLAKKIWADVMEGSLTGGSRWFTQPGGVTQKQVDARSGLPASGRSTRKVNLFFRTDNLPY